MPSRWNPETFDPAFLTYYKRGLTDYEIKNRMLDEGFPVDLSDVIAARRRLGLEPRKKIAQGGWEKDRPVNQKPNPVAMAKLWFGKRLVEKQSGYFLDGEPMSTPMIVRKLNEMLRNSGAEQLGPPQWRVP